MCLGHPQRHAHPGNAGHVLHPFSDLARGLRPGRLAAPLAVGDPEQDDSVARAQVDRYTEISHRGTDVTVQYLLELLPVPPFEHDLAQLEQHARLVGSRELRHSPSLPADTDFMGPAGAWNRVLAPVFPAPPVDSVAP